MNIPMSWLKEYVALDCDIKTFIDDITMSGSKVETVAFLAEEIRNVVVGKILKIDKHPDADKLVVCQIDVGNTQLQIVTGATNVFEGAFVPVARDGAILANDMKIKTGKLRGQVSEGMLCSVEELGFTRNDYPEAPEDGIYIFQQEEPLGADVVELLQMKDAVVEFEITSNRPDCFSVLGIAREAAATFRKPFQYPEITVKEEADGDIAQMIQVQIENPTLCARYIARVVKDVKIAPSPLWLRHKLTAAGVRPINNIVDITNYVMLELGQPMHAFDIDFVHDRRIIVRNATENETFVTLDGVTRQLDPSMLVIADPEKAIAIAGVMGGENSKVTEQASAILLESACFYGTNVRLTSKKLGLRTDASSKFEKGLDPNLALEGINRAAQLIELLGCGTVVKGMVDCYPNVRSVWTVPYDAKRINQLLGTQISETEIQSLLQLVGVKTKDSVAYIPTFRPDLLAEADLAEEVARMYGYNRIETTLAAGTPTVGKKTRNQQIQDIVKNLMVAEGLCEGMNYSFESPKVFDKLCIPTGHPLRQTIKINNPLGEDFSVMRTLTLNGMLQSLGINYNRRNEQAKLFEISTVYHADQLPLTALPTENLMLTMGLYGGVDFYATKGILEVLFQNLNIANVEYERESQLPFMHPGRTARIMVQGNEIGYVGEVHPAVLNNYEIGTKAYVAVVSMEALYANAILTATFKALPKFPDMKRDISMVVKEDVLVKDIEKVIKENGGKLLESVQLFDVYKGEQVGEGMKSVAFKIIFRAPDRTLTDEEVSSAMKKILKNLAQKMDVQLRDK